MGADEERERGPLEREIHELIRTKSLGSPFYLEPAVAGREFTPDEMAKQAMYGTVVLMEAILRLARELDERAT
jgi:hypothetical protein